MTKPKGVFKKRVNKGNRFYKVSSTAIQNLGLAGQTDASFQSPSQGPSPSFLDRPSPGPSQACPQNTIPVSSSKSKLSSEYALSRVMET